MPDKVFRDAGGCANRMLEIASSTVLEELDQIVVITPTCFISVRDQLGDAWATGEDTVQNVGFQGSLLIVHRHVPD